MWISGSSAVSTCWAPTGRACPGAGDLGPEPLSPSFTPDVLAAALAGRQTSVKAALLNQALVAGLGNIYVDEALFCARIHPARPAGTLTEEEVARLHGCIRRVLARAVEKRGTTFSLYRDGEGNEGDMYDELQVFDRAGEPCPACGTTIQKVAVAPAGPTSAPAASLRPRASRSRRCAPGRAGAAGACGWRRSRRVRTSESSGAGHLPDEYR